jgi:hypothetical protein
MARRRRASDQDRPTRGGARERTSPHPHDALFKKTFAIREHALDLIRHQLPAELVAALDPGSLSRDSEHHIDEVSLSESRSDVLYTARLRGEEVLIYILIEHQSTQDPMMPFRLLRYVVRIWERWLADATVAAKGVAPTTLPPVIPFVLHQGPRPWSVARSLADLVPLPAALAPLVRPFMPGLDVSILDLGDGGPEALRKWRARPIVKVTLAVMRAGPDPRLDILLVYRAFPDELALIVKTRAGREALASLAGYTLGQRSDLDVAALASTLTELAGPRAGDVVMSTAQELIDQGASELLTRLVQAKFGRLSGDVTRRIAEGTREELERWAEQVLTAERIDDVFTTARAPRPRRSRTKRPRKS